MMDAKAVVMEIRFRRSAKDAKGPWYTSIVISCGILEDGVAWLLWAGVLVLAVAVLVAIISSLLEEEDDESRIASCDFVGWWS